MELQYLGTAAAEGWPGLFCQCPVCREAIRRGGKNIRRRSGALLNGRILIDFSADLYYAKNSFALDLGEVRHVVLTHGHADHYYLNNLELYMTGFAYYNQPSPLTLYGSAYTAELYSRYLCAPEVQHLPEFVRFCEVRPYQSFEAEGTVFTPLPAVHGCPDSYIYLLSRGEESWLYGNDTDLWQEDVWRFLRGRRLSVVSLDATYGPRVEHLPGHMNFKNNIEVRDRMLKEGLADERTHFICTHFSHNGGMLHEEMVEQMRGQGFEIAYDGLTVTSPTATK